MQLLESHAQLTLSASELLEFNLFELSAAERRVEMKTILFSLWNKLTTMQNSLKGIVHTGIALFLDTNPNFLPHVGKAVE